MAGSPVDVFLGDLRGSKSVLWCQDTHEKLESCVFNSISLGQWELAGANLRSLSLSGEASIRDAARDLLKVLILESPNHW